MRKYAGANNLIMELEYKMDRGYAVGFFDLLDTVMAMTSKERILVKREAVPTYPKVAVREFMANLKLRNPDTGINESVILWDIL